MRIGRRHGAFALAKAARSGLFLAETVLDEGGQRVERGFGLAPGRLDEDLGARSGREHHQAHDRIAADPLALARDPDLGVEALDAAHEFGGGAGMQAALVADQERARRSRRRRTGLAHFPDRTWLATLMYLRPASWARPTAFSSGESPRTLANLMSIGRFTPATTSMRPWSMIEMARLDGVPPNMSVSTATPCPESTCRTASTMSWRRRSMSSSGPMDTDAICGCGPTTCSSAATNSSASRPWVTRTRPIMTRSAKARRAAHLGRRPNPRQAP